MVQILFKTCRTTSTFEGHLQKLDEVFACIKDGGLKVNANKSCFVPRLTPSKPDVPGCWITHDGVQPWLMQSKQLQNPKTKKDLSFHWNSQLAKMHADALISNTHSLLSHVSVSTPQGTMITLAAWAQMLSFSWRELSEGNATCQCLQFAHRLIAMTFFTRRTFSHDCVSSPFVTLLLA